MPSFGHFEHEESPDEIMRLQRIERGRQRPGAPYSRVPRDNGMGRTNSNADWFRHGHLIPKDDARVSPFNLGMGAREIQGFSDENTRPWGIDTFARSSLTDRVREAERRGRNQRRRGWSMIGRKKSAPSGWIGRLVERRRGMLGQHERVTKKNRHWFSSDR